MKISKNNPSGTEICRAKAGDGDEFSGTAVMPLRAISIILAHGVIRLQQRQKELDNSTEQTLQNVADRPMFLLDAMKSKTVRGEPNVLNT